MQREIEIVRLSLDVDEVSHGEDETYTAEEIREAGGVDALVEAYVHHHLERIAGIHGIEPSEAGPEHVEVSETRES